MITLEPTADGSNTLYVPELNEHYHSVKGALTESAHIFIQMGLNHAQAVNPRVLEIGFGTGLNAFSDLAGSRKKAKEPFTLPALNDSLFRKILYANLPIRKQSLRKSVKKFYALHTAPWNQEVKTLTLFHASQDRR